MNSTIIIFLLVLRSSQIESFSKTVHREHDFYVIETTIEASHLINSCQFIIKKANLVFNSEAYNIQGNRNLHQDITKRANYCIQQVSRLIEKDFVVTDYVQTIKKKAEDKKPKLDISEFKERLGISVGHHEYDAMSKALHKVYKRSLDFLGEGWHLLTGAPGPTEYGMEQKFMEKIKIALVKQSNINNVSSDQLNFLKHRAKDVTQSVRSLGIEFAQLKIRFDNATTIGLKGLFMVVFQTKCMHALEQIESKVTDLKIAIAQAQFGQLSRLVIKKQDLSKILHNIGSKVRKLAPLSPISNLEQYYELKTTKIYRRQDRILFYTRIPLIDTDYSASMYPITATTKEITRSKADFILETNNGLYYSTVSYAEVNRFISVGDYGYISAERQIIMSNRGHMQPEEHMKDIWVDSVTRQLFVIKSNSKIDAKLICRENITKVDIPKYCEVYLPEYCSLHSDQFVI